jgi:flagellar motility protein MotE (MotC chaperone)
MSTTPAKFDETELKEVEAIRNSYAEASMVYGNLYIQRKQLDSQEKALDEAYSKLQKREKDFLDKIVNKYGEGSLDAKTGVFTPSPKK